MGHRQDNSDNKACFAQDMVETWVHLVQNEWATGETRGAETDLGNNHGVQMACDDHQVTFYLPMRNLCF